MQNETRFGSAWNTRTVIATVVGIAVLIPGCGGSGQSDSSEKAPIAVKLDTPTQATVQRKHLIVRGLVTPDSTVVAKSSTERLPSYASETGHFSNGKPADKFAMFLTLQPGANDYRIVL